MSTDRPGLVSVIGAGWSLANIDRSRIPGLRIGANDAGWRIPCTYAVTMDRLFLENRREQLGQAGRAGTTVYFRRGIEKNVHPLGANWLPFSNDHVSTRLSKEVGTLNGTNTGLCAINLAYQLHPRRLLLWGFDMCRSADGRPYFHEPYPWAKPAGATSDRKYEIWAAEFADVARQLASRGIETLNASPVSKITAFKKIDPRKVLS